MHDHLPINAGLTFFPKLAAFNISWHERPIRSIYSYVSPKGWLTKPGMENYDGLHAAEYCAWIEEAGVGQ
ncbi:hypothetical protein [Novosphingobium meiothermophilum]|uniref:hypothetical protein n=1 Tax=Novosphingobium meiothermophilum TaxID=2202251 RepID=UPI000D6E708D|nr:hypothetical protein [Novosphingobium meiothermophilum]